MNHSVQRGNITESRGNPFCLVLWKKNWYNLLIKEPLTHSSVQFSCSVVSLSVTQWTAAHQASLSITNSRSLLKLMSIASVMPSNHLFLCGPLLLPSAIFPSNRVFSNESVLHIKWPKYWSFSFSISPSNEYSGLISFRIYCLDLLAVQGTLKSLLQHHSSKTPILWCSAFFTVQFSHPYMTTGKNMALTKRTFVAKVMSLLFNKLSRLIITFLPRSKRLLISWLQSPSAVILEPPQNEVCHWFHCFPIYLQWSDGTRYHDLSFLNAESWANFSTLLLYHHQEAISSSLLSATRVVSSAYLRFLIFLPAVLTPAVLHPVQHFSWCALHIS